MHWVRVILITLGVWTLLAVPATLFFGRFMRVGLGPRTPTATGDPMRTIVSINKFDLDDTSLLDEEFRKDKEKHATQEAKPEAQEHVDTDEAPDLADN
jgi:hypothetical protein